LVDEYKFSSKNADEIISKLQEFYNGSDPNGVPVITGIDYVESSVKKYSVD
jgi:hypothetical protein